MMTFHFLIQYALGLSLIAEAFIPLPTPPPETRSSSSSSLVVRSLHGGWDNDNFMDSLGQGQAEQQEANDQYYEIAQFGRPEEQPWSNVNTATTNTEFPSPPVQQPLQPPPQQFQQQQQQQQQQPGQIDPSQTENQHPPQVAEDGSTLLPSQDVGGATFTEEMKAEVIASHTPEEEASQGGERFRALMNRAKASAVTQLDPQQQIISPNAPALELSIEEQARLFREIMNQRQQQFQFQQQQQQQQQYQYQQLQNPYGQPQPNPYAQQQQPQLAPPNPYGQEQPQQAQMPPSNPAGASPQYTTQQQIPNQEQQQLATSSSDPYSQQLAAAYAQQGQQHMPNTAPEPPQQPYVQQPHSQEQQPQPSSSSYPPTQQPPLRQAIYPSQLQQRPNNYLEPGVGFDGRKIGRNRDADVVANTSDAYFARLKRDSTTRNYARYAGDDVKANDVFHDPEISKIHAPTNPYLEEKRARERDMLETVPEEMLLFQEYDTTEKGEDASTIPQNVVSYKDKLAQFKAKRSNGGQ